MKTVCSFIFKKIVVFSRDDTVTGDLLQSAFQMSAPTHPPKEKFLLY